MTTPVLTVPVPVSFCPPVFSFFNCGLYNWMCLCVCVYRGGGRKTFGNRKMYLNVQWPENNSEVFFWIWSVSGSTCLCCIVGLLCRLGSELTTLCTLQGARGYTMPCQPMLTQITLLGFETTLCYELQHFNSTCKVFCSYRKRILSFWRNKDSISPTIILQHVLNQSIFVLDYVCY